MSGDMRQLGRQTLIYGAGVALSKLAGFLMLPIYTRYLTPSDYGVLELLEMTVEIVSVVTAVGLSAAVFKFHADYDDPGEKDEVISSAWAAIMATGILGAVAGIVASPWLTQLVFHGQQPAVYFRLFFLIFFLGRLELIPMLLLRVRHRSVAFVAVSVAKLVLQLSLTIYFVVYAGWTVEGVLMGNMLASLIVGGGLTVYLFKEVGWRYNREKLRRMVRFSWPIMASGLGSFVVISSDRYFVNVYSGTYAVGIYSLSYRFVGILTSVAFLPFTQVWEPLRFELIKRADGAATFPKVFTYMNCILLGVAALIAINVADVVRIMADPAFALGYEPVAILVGATVMFHWGAYSNIGLLHNHRTDIIGWLSLYNVAIVLGLNWLLIPRWGYMGAAWATFFAYGLRYVAIYVFSQRQYPIAYEWGRVFRLGAIFTATSLARIAVGFPSLPVSLSADAALSLAAVLLMWGLVLEEPERAAATELLQSRLASLRRLLPQRAG
jgi:O-antigen/teichoic acid export membrane protein